LVFFFSSRRRHTRFSRDWSSDVCSSDLPKEKPSSAEVATLAVAIVINRAVSIGNSISPFLYSSLARNANSFDPPPAGINPTPSRSEERRVGKESRSGRSGKQ